MNMKNVLKKVFLVLLVLDIIDLVSAAISLIPGFNGMDEYGQMVMGVAAVFAVVTMAVMLFEILAKVFMLRSMAPEFSWATGGKGYRTAAKLLLVFNLCGLIINLLATGGEGATLLNQSRMYLSVLASAVEMIAAFVYLRAFKKLCSENIKAEA